MKAATLFKIHQVGRRVNSGLVASLQINSFQHGASRPLAIGSRHSDDGNFESQGHAIGHLAHSAQTHFDGLGMQLLAIVEPFTQCFHMGKIVAESASHFCQ